MYSQGFNNKLFVVSIGGGEKSWNTFLISTDRDTKSILQTVMKSFVQSDSCLLQPILCHIRKMPSRDLDYSCYKLQLTRRFFHKPYKVLR